MRLLVQLPSSLRRPPQHPLRDRTATVDASRPHGLGIVSQLCSVHYQWRSGQSGNTDSCQAHEAVADVPSAGCAADHRYHRRAREGHTRRRLPRARCAPFHPLIYRPSVKIVSILRYHEHHDHGRTSHKHLRSITDTDLCHDHNTARVARRQPSLDRTIA